MLAEFVCTVPANAVEEIFHTELMVAQSTCHHTTQKKWFLDSEVRKNRSVYYAAPKRTIVLLLI